jgi:hypothetical protein
VSVPVTVEEPILTPVLPPFDDRDLLPALWMERVCDANWRGQFPGVARS